MSFDIGINFRSTAAYVTDGANETYCNSDAYPTTRGGATFGWEDAGSASRDRINTIDRRLAGINFQTATAKRFRIDLPSSGSAAIHCAVGDAGSTNHVDWDFRDGTTSLFQTSGTSIGTNFNDANNLARTETTWPTSETSQSVTFAGTIFRVVSNSANTNVIAHVRVVSTSGTIVFADCSAPIEHIVTAQRDSFNPEESLSTTQRDSFHPMERLRDLQRDAVNPIEHLSTAQRDSFHPEEHLVALQKDSFGSEEYLASLVRDSFDPAEHLTVLQKDAVGPDEYLASTFKDAVTPEEHLAALSTDGFSPDEYTASTQVDLPLPEESLATATRDSAQPSERLADMTRDSVTPLEWGGAISVTVDAGCPVEWLTTVKTDTFAPMEWLSPTPAPVLVNAILVGGFSLVAPSISFSLVAPSLLASLE